MAFDAVFVGNDELMEAGCMAVKFFGGARMTDAYLRRHGRRIIAAMERRGRAGASHALGNDGHTRQSLALRAPVSPSRIGPVQ